MVIVSLLGAGCVTQPVTRSTQPVPVPVKNGFGKLPGLTPSGAPGNPEASVGAYGNTPSASVSASPVPTPSAPQKVEATAMMAADASVTVTNGNAVGGSAGMRIMPVPPMPEKPVNVIYKVSATLPAWGAEGQVLRVRRPEVDAGVIRGLAVPAGLPSVLADQVKQVQGVNMSWIDKEDFQWNFDPMYGNLNWWKQYDPRILAEMESGRVPEPNRDNPAAVDKARVMAAADRFLDAHGLSALRAQGGVLDEMAWMDSASAPCLLKGAEAMVRSTEAATAIYPGPCGWYPADITVFYGTRLEGLPAVDVGGWPFRLSSVQVSLQDYSVRGGNVQLTNDLDRSAYPLIERTVAMKRLEAGGRNPVYGWGEPMGGDIRVNITSVELAWMRFDSWADNKQQSYYLPALAAKGTVDRNIQGQQPEEYHTVVPLVTDESFDIGPEPGIPVPMPLIVEPAVSEPAVMPEKQ